MRDLGAVRIQFIRDGKGQSKKVGRKENARLVRWKEQGLEQMVVVVVGSVSQTIF